MQLDPERRIRVAALLEHAAGEYSVLSRVYFDAAESARQTSSQRLLDELELMAEKLGAPA